VKPAGSRQFCANRAEVEELACFRGLPLACGLSLLCWLALAAFALGIYELSS
jgi:hypothetical protein